MKERNKKSQCNKIIIIINRKKSINDSNETFIGKFSIFHINRQLNYLYFWITVELFSIIKKDMD